MTLGIMGTCDSLEILIIQHLRVIPGSEMYLFVRETLCQSKK